MVMQELTNMQFSMGRWVFLGALSVLLSYFVPFVFLAPIPLTMAYLLYGRLRGVVLSLSALVMLVLASLFTTFPSYVAGVFLFVLLIAQLTYEFLERGIEPTKGLLRGGLAIFLLLASLMGGVLLLSDLSLKDGVTKAVELSFTRFKAENAAQLQGSGEEVRLLREFLDHPEKIVKTILHWGVAYLFVSVFFALWINLFMVLRSSVLWRRRIKYNFTARHLITFQIPFYFVYPLIVALTLMVLGEKYVGVLGTTIGGNILWCLGVFYFFQGFGVYSDLLNFLKIYGFFRNLLMAMTMIFAWKVVAIAGVLDNWINFRKFFKQKNDNNEGDML